MKFEAIAVENIPLIQKGDDLASIICENIDMEDRDIVVIASTIVGKAEGLTFRLEDVIPGERALKLASRNGQDPRFVQAVLDRSREILVETPFILATNLAGHTCVNSGIDDSNVEGELLLNTPENPDSSASKIGEELETLSGKKLSVVVTDTNGRAFKVGQTGIAIGLYKIKPIKRWIGEKDLFGKTLEITEQAVADELAGAANLLMGEGNGGFPVVVIRGLDYYCEENPGIEEMYRPEELDIIKKGLRSLQKKTEFPDGKKHNEILK